MKIALAMYTVYEQMKRDLEGTLERVRRMGYQGVEFYGESAWPASEAKELLERHGLAVCGWHVEWKLLQPDTIVETIAYHKELGNPNLIVPCLGGPWNIAHTAEQNSAETWLRHAERIDRIADRLEAEGLTLGYHTHAHEFEDSLDGVTPWDILLNRTKPSVFLELDTGNCLEGGADPVRALKQAAGRLKVVHCKPYGLLQGTETMIAEDGDLNDWPGILESCEAGGCEWLAVENEAATRGDKLYVAGRDFRSLARQLRLPGIDIQ